MEELKVKYENCVIFKPTISDVEIDNIIDKYTSFMNILGVNVITVDVSGRHKLAYKIKNYLEGIYVVFYYNTTKEIEEKITRQLRIDNNVIKFIDIEETETPTIDFEDLQKQIENSNNTNLWKGIANEIIDNIEDRIDNEDDDYNNISYDDIVEITNNILYGDSDFYDMLCNRIDDELNKLF